MSESSIHPHEVMNQNLSCEKQTVSLTAVSEHSVQIKSDLSSLNPMLVFEFEWKSDITAVDTVRLFDSDIVFGYWNKNKLEVCSKAIATGIINVPEQLSTYLYEGLTHFHLFLSRLFVCLFVFLLQTHLPNIKVHAYFAPVTPPPSVGGSRQRFCRCCVLLWCKANSPLFPLPVSLVHAPCSQSFDPWPAPPCHSWPLVTDYMLVCPPFGAAERGREPNNTTGSWVTFPKTFLNLTTAHKQNIYNRL